MECNGKCHLKKELKKNTEEQSNSKSQARKVIQEELPSQNTVCIVETGSKELLSANIPYIENYISSVLENCTPPPQV